MGHVIFPTVFWMFNKIYEALSISPKMNFCSHSPVDTIKIFECYQQTFQDNDIFCQIVYLLQDSPPNGC